MVAVAVSGSSLVGIGLSLLNGYGAYRFDLHRYLQFWTLGTGHHFIGARAFKD
jgi:hypothetical protein